MSKDPKPHMQDDSSSSCPLAKYPKIPMVFSPILPTQEGTDGAIDSDKVKIYSDDGGDK